MIRRPGTEGSLPRPSRGTTAAFGLGIGSVLIATARGMPGGGSFDGLGALEDAGSRTTAGANGVASA